MATEVISPEPVVTGEPGPVLGTHADPRPSVEDYFGYQIALRPARRSATYEAAKRLMDIAGASLAIVLLSPLLIIVALWIKLSDFGPVFYCQTRVGKGGRHFRFYKFRSMVRDADRLKDDLVHLNHHEDDRTFKIPDDPRITSIGRFIRRFSIDEIPQLWNVIRGEMSLVGPRPPVPEEVELYTEFDRRRFEVKPGLTCIWQVRGRGNVGFETQILMDVEYIDERSLLLDTKLLVLTLPAVLHGHGAY